MSLNRRIFLSATGAALAVPAFAKSRKSHVKIQDFTFEPNVLQVTLGDTIVFTNYDLAPHTATALDGSWDTGTLNMGDSATLTVSDEWSGDYFCVHHPAMTAQLKFS